MAQAAGSFPWKHIVLPEYSSDIWVSAADIAGILDKAEKDLTDNDLKPFKCYFHHMSFTEDTVHGICVMRPGAYLPYHIHAASELYLPLKGSCTLHIDGKKTTISGESHREGVYIPGNCPHGLRNETEEDYEFLYLYYPPKGTEPDTKLKFCCGDLKDCKPVNGYLM